MHAVQEAWHANAAAIVGTMFEVLCAMPATASAQLASWSGGLEAGVVAAAPVPKEGAKARKKRKLQDAQQGAIAAAGSRAEQSALWASTQAQQQAYRCAAALTTSACLLLFQNLTESPSVPICIRALCTRASRIFALRSSLRRRLDASNVCVQ